MRRGQNQTVDRDEAKNILSSRAHVRRAKDATKGWQSCRSYDSNLPNKTRVNYSNRMGLMNCIETT